MVVLKHGAGFFELGLPVVIRRSAACVELSISCAEGVPPLPVMIGLHTTLYPELDIGTGVSPLFLAIVAVPRSPNFPKPDDFCLSRGA